jgi:phosphoribosylaminoimidazole-succinocarboxamide synthase
MKSLLFFVSGKGTNLGFILDKISGRELSNCRITGVVSNQECLGLTRSIRNRITGFYRPWDRQNETRESYDRVLLSFVDIIKPDIIVLAGWDHILSPVFIDNLGDKTIINLHPALINTFPGNNAIEDAYNAAQKGEVNKTGIMVHTVTNKLDIGEVVAEIEIPIDPTYTLKTLEEKIKYREKFVLLEAIEKLTTILFKKGKVKDIYNISNHRLLIIHTDRLSSCNKVVCDLEGKGFLLSKLTQYWFTKTNEIIRNHVIEQKDNYIIAEKCKLIPVEFIVRGYITGSMWKKYNEGERVFCGNALPANLKQYQKLDNFILTPTTKDDNDLPIDYQYIIDNKLLSQEDLDFIYEVCFKLYIVGQYECSSKGLIMCDTKYEFGRNREGKIVLIDEIHTIESTRYWKKDTYETRISAGLAPENLDKDIIRDYVKKGQKVPEDVLDTLITYYKYIYETLSGKQITHVHPYKHNDIEILIDKYNNI